MGVIPPGDWVTTAVGAYYSTLSFWTVGVSSLLTIGPGYFISILGIASHIAASPKLHL